jgi:hypothetical protein
MPGAVGEAVGDVPRDVSSGVALNSDEVLGSRERGPRLGFGQGAACGPAPEPSSTTAVKESVAS